MCGSSAAGALSTKVGREPQGPALFPSSQQEVVSHSLGHEVLITEVVSCAVESVVCLKEHVVFLVWLLWLLILEQKERGQFKDSLLGQN